MSSCTTAYQEVRCYFVSLSAFCHALSQRVQRRDSRQPFLRDTFADFCACVCVGGKSVWRGHTQSLRGRDDGGNGARGVPHFGRVDSLRGRRELGSPRAAPFTRAG